MSYLYKRKKINIKVKREFQVWLLIRIFGAVVLSSAVAALILYFYAQHETVSSFYEAHIKIRRVSELLLPVVAAGAFVSLISGAFLALFIPLKIAGPIFRIERELAKVRKGNLTVNIKLRKKDRLKDFANTVNETISSLRENVQQVKEANSALKKSLEDGDKEEIARMLEVQKESLDRIKT